MALDNPSDNSTISRRTIIQSLRKISGAHDLPRVDAETDVARSKIAVWAPLRMYRFDCDGALLESVVTSIRDEAEWMPLSKDLEQLN